MMKRISVFAAVLSLALCFGAVTAKASGAQEEINERCIVSIAVDVSGSMVKTDAGRDVPETIKMLIDLCDDNDCFSVITYNDHITYSSGLVETGNAEKVRGLKQDVDGISYGGDTDNGLGLITAVKAITESGREYDKAVVILISDGNTDLPNSSLGRTVADSDKDTEMAGRLAKDGKVSIQIMEYVCGRAIDSGKLSVAASATGGGVGFAENPTQFVQVMLNTFFSVYNQGATSFETTKTEDTINRISLEGPASDQVSTYYVIYASDPIADIELSSKNYQIAWDEGSRHATIRSGPDSEQALEVLYGLENAGEVMVGTIRADKKFLEEPVIKEIEKEVTVEVPVASKVPEGKNYEDELYTTSEKLQLDVRRLFKDDDIVKYVLKTKDDRAELVGSTLNLDVSKEGEIELKIRAIDAAGNEAEAKVEIKVIASWRQYQTLLIGILVFVIVLITLIVCVVIIRKILFPKQKKTKRITGKLVARFIDIKTKNDLDVIQWDLRDYPPDGVSLEELFHSKNVKEELKDIDKVCFYPGEQNHSLTMVHCIEGGVFVGDHHVKANVPATVRNGDKIYVSIAENASEIELTYTV